MTILTSSTLFRWNRLFVSTSPVETIADTTADPVATTTSALQDELEADPSPSYLKHDKYNIKTCFKENK